MKVKKLSITNIGLIESLVLELDKPLILFYGEIRQGKTTILNAVRWCLGGAFPADIIRHGETEAFTQLDFEGGSIRREWYVGRDGTTKAREVVFTRDNKPVQNPIAEIKKFLNPFLLDQDHFRNMSALERSRYLVKLFGVDTKAHDENIASLAGMAKDLRARLSGYGGIDLTPVGSVNVAAMQADLDLIRAKHAQDVKQWQVERAAMCADHATAVNLAHAATSVAEQRSRDREQHRNQCCANERQIAAWHADIEMIQKQIAQRTAENAELALWDTQNPPLPIAIAPAAPNTAALDAAIATQPDTAALEAAIAEGAAQNERHYQYLRNQKRAQEKECDERLLQERMSQQRDAQAKKVQMLKTLGANCGVPDLEFDEQGSFRFEGCAPDMLSTSQVMKLSEKLAALYPEGFGLDLIDRGESLGRSIFDFIALAKAEDKTILATIVGDKPATTPAGVGVFVVENGKVSP